MLSINNSILECLNSYRSRRIIRPLNVTCEEIIYIGNTPCSDTRRVLGHVKPGLVLRPRPEDNPHVVIVFSSSKRVREQFIRCVHVREAISDFVENVRRIPVHPIPLHVFRKLFLRHGFLLFASRARGVVQQKRHTRQRNRKEQLQRPEHGISPFP